MTPSIVLRDNHGKIIDSFFIQYHAGNLSMEKSDYEKLIDPNIKKIEMELKYSNIYEDEIYYYDYKIDVKKGWFKNYFFILYIYNTDKKKYRKIYEPLEGRDYTFEYNSSNGQMLRVTKKRRKNNM